MGMTRIAEFYIDSRLLGNLPSLLIRLKNTENSAVCHPMNIYTMKSNQKNVQNKSEPVFTGAVMEQKMYIDPKKGSPVVIFWLLAVSWRSLSNIIHAFARLVSSEDGKETEKEGKVPQANK
jgi:hypothetical protein